MTPYLRDMMPLAPAGKPLAVVFPTDVAAVQACVRVCAAAGVPIVPRGAGSGLSGAANATDGCVMLATSKLDEIVEFDPVNRLAVVQAGVVNQRLRTLAAEHGLFYPPDPSSLAVCTIGGNLATNAGGLCCVKYGVAGADRPWPIPGVPERFGSSVMHCPFCHGWEARGRSCPSGSPARRPHTHQSSRR